MSLVRDVALVDELRALPAEAPWVEFKGNNTDPDMIGKRCSALSNAAASKAGTSPTCCGASMTPAMP